MNKFVVALATAVTVLPLVSAPSIAQQEEPSPSVHGIAYVACPEQTKGELDVGCRAPSNLGLGHETVDPEVFILADGASSQMTDNDDLYELAVAASPDDGYLVYSASNGGVSGDMSCALYRTMPGASDRTLTSEDDDCHWPMGWSPDETRLLYVSSYWNGGSALKVVSADTGVVRALMNSGSETAEIWEAGWLTNHEVIYSADPDGRAPGVFTLDLTTGRIEPVFRGWVTGLKVASDRSRVAFWRHNREWTRNNVYVMRPDSGVVENVTRTHRRAETMFAFSPDGRFLAVTSTRPNAETTTVAINVYDLLRGKHHRVVDASRIPVWSYTKLVWSPDGKRIAFQSGGDGRPDAIFTVHRDGSRTRKVVAGPASLHDWN